MRKVVLSLCMVICVAGCASPAWAQGGLDQRVSELSQQIASKMSAKQKTTVAVVEFTDLQGNVTDFGRFLAEELITRLYDTEKFKVIERQLLNRVIAEQKLSLTGIVDPTSAKQLGKVLGVDAIVSGTITNLAQSLKVNARLISTGTGEIFAVASAEIFKDESVTLLMSAGTRTTIASSGSTPPSAAPSKNAPIKVVANDFTIQLNSCRMSGANVTCQLTIINNSSVDRKFALGGPDHLSRMFDEFGNEYRDTEAQLGSRTSDGWSGAWLVLVPQVVTKAMIRFDKVNSEATTITLLRLVCWFTDDAQGKWSADWSVDFRNVQITK